VPDWPRPRGQRAALAELRAAPAVNTAAIQELAKQNQALQSAWDDLEKLVMLLVAKSPDVMKPEDYK